MIKQDKYYKITNLIRTDEYYGLENKIVKILAITPSKIFLECVYNGGNLIINQTITINNCKQNRDSLKLSSFNTKLWKVINERS